MANRTWSVLESCKMQCSETICKAVNDRLNDLPHEILLLILSSLSMKEAARTSVLSHRWKYMWLHLPVLVFQADSSAVQDQSLRQDERLLSQQRSGFTRWVNSVVEAHCGQAIDELRLIFDLDVNCQSDIDKWMVFAVTKQVKRLELDFTPLRGRNYSFYDCYTWPLESRLSCLGLHRHLASLTSLCLKYVNVTAQDIECVLLSCHALEDLCIVEDSINLTQIKLPHSSLQLKKLEASRCRRLTCIDILAPKLVSFTYHGHPIMLHIRNASLLSEISIGYGGYHIYRGEIVAYAYGYLRSYFTQLVYLSLDIFLNCTSPSATEMCNSGIDNPPTMTNLKHLELRVTARCDRSLLGWASLIEASPVLEKLTLKFPSLLMIEAGASYTRNIERLKGHPLKRLKTVKHVGILGVPLEKEFLTYLVENSIMLKQVIHLKPRVSHFYKVREYAEERVKEFKRTLPQGVKMRQRAYRNPQGGDSL